jgi:hypothetical protein
MCLMHQAVSMSWYVRPFRRHGRQATLRIFIRRSDGMPQLGYSVLPHNELQQTVSLAILFVTTHNVRTRIGHSRFDDPSQRKICKRCTRPSSRIAAPACIALPTAIALPHVHPLPARASRFAHVHPLPACAPASRTCTRFPHVHSLPARAPASPTCIPLRACASRFPHLHRAPAPIAGIRTTHGRHPHHAWPAFAYANRLGNAALGSDSRASEPSIHPIHSMLT